MAISSPLFRLWRAVKYRIRPLKNIEKTMNALHKGSSTISISEDQAYQIVITSGFALTDRAIDDRRLKHALMSDTCGALATFEGWVRNHNNARPVTKLTYYGYEQLALKPKTSLTSKTPLPCTVLATLRLVRWRCGLG